MTWRDESPWFLPGDVAAGGSVSKLMVTDTAARIWAARNAYLARLPVAEVVEIVDHVVGLWLEPESPWVKAAALRIAAATAYSQAMVRTGLTRLLAGCRKEALLSLLQEELGDPGVLDGFRPRRAAGGSHRACGPTITTHIFSGNVPGLPAISLIQALLVKSASLGKPASEELVFPALFARSLAAVDSKLAASVAILPWPGGDGAIEHAAFAASETVVAYGSDAAVESIRSRVPAGVRFVAHGHRLSFGVIGRESLDLGTLDALAERAAYDVSLFDQQGCVSAHLLYVERGGAVPPEAFAERLASAMGAFEREMPRGKLLVEEAAAIQQARAEVELREMREEPVRQWASPHGTAWTVIYEDDPSFIPSCLNRVVRVKPVTDLREIPSLVRPFSRYLQTVGTAMSPERRARLAEALAPFGACRVCAIGEMPHPPLTWHHDGGFSLLPLLRWTAIEG
ncbi:MAG TPA: acyl-CoA reductase [Candidatus Methylomirabilis sp.]|nr:acyl-CoA reductase [Candidatus Methylomirabilis sp.]